MVTVMTTAIAVTTRGLPDFGQDCWSYCDQNNQKAETNPILALP
jgi:hypothetical protein